MKNVDAKTSRSDKSSTKSYAGKCHPRAQAETRRKPYRVQPFEGGFKPEFEGMTPKEILNKLDDEYYAKKLAGGADEYDAQKAAE